MRTSLPLRPRSWVIVAVVGALVWACGSSAPKSGFDTATSPAEPDDAGGAPGSFDSPDSGSSGPTCTPLTCATAKANCGPVGDGCGGVINDCGSCSGDESCGGGGTPSQCGKPACTPKTCLEVGANCGPVGDGCGGVIGSCGSCNTAIGEICGGGGPSRCGTGLGDGGVATDGGAACVPKTCADVGANCGPVADGCGGLVASCGTCASPQTCGGGGIPSVCGGTACKPKTCASAGANCGPIGDGCGGLVNCGTCTTAGQICGGGGTANVCGGTATVPCTGLCTQQTTCAGGGTTSISGTVTTPNGTLPIYGALVYVPNAPVAAFTPGVSCDQCGAAASGSPLVSTTTGPDGTFLLPNVPVSDPTKVTNIPVVVQLGRWRKQFTVTTTACTNTVVAATKSALPHNKSEGDIPLTAISTGALDALECVFRKIGIDDAEFSDPSGTGRIRFYQDNGALITKKTKTVPGTPAASALYSSQAEIDKYDQVIFACVGDEEDKPATDQAIVQSYANKGGRVFATHYSYVWLYNAAPWSTTAAWDVDVDLWDSVTANVDTSFPKGMAFAQWLSIVGALTSPLPNPKITLDEPRHDVNDPVTSPAQRWLYTDTSGAPAKSVQHFTFNTEWGKPAAQQCGRVLFSDFHVTTNSDTTGDVFPSECTTGPLSAQEKVLAFMLFDLGSCITVPAPPPPTCAPKTCAAEGISCGPAGDGCGNTIDCGPCAAGTTCGGGGTPSVCGAPSCTKQACKTGECGTLPDGCGGTMTCPPCAPGQVCGGGGANVCGTATCTKLSCSDAPAGTCGPVADGCGGIDMCTCPPGVPCVNGKCGAPPCTPKTCAEMGANCGNVADGCGGILDCGQCLAPQTCGGGGNANVCGGGVN